MTRTKKVKSKLTVGEKKLYTLGIMCFLFTILLKVFCGTSISSIKMDIEDINYKISNQENKNDSLTMQVNELTSYENISSVLKDMGLAYNNENIVVINK